MLQFCVPNVVYLYELQMRIVKHFSVDPIKFGLEKKRRLYFDDFFVTSDV